MFTTPTRSLLRPRLSRKTILLTFAAPLLACGSADAPLSIIVPSVVSVTIAPPSISLAVGTTQQFTVTPKDLAGTPLAGRTITFAIDNPAVATISPTGLLTAVGAGAATLTATSESQSITAAVTVTVPVASVALVPATPSIVVGFTQQFTATPKDGAGNPRSRFATMAMMSEHGSFAIDETLQTRRPWS